MNSKSIGSLINEGASSDKIRVEYPDFPFNVDKDYFISLGYKSSSASVFLSKLKKNDSIALDKFKSSGFLTSEKFDLNNILLDTSALGHNSCTNILDKAKYITILYPTLCEFDKYKNSTENVLLAQNIRHYTDLALRQKEKFLTSSFGKNSPREYCDNIILDYLSISPITTRPTLLTADKNLALKASTLGFEYVLYDAELNKTSNVSSNSKKSNMSTNSNNSIVFNDCNVKIYNNILSLNNNKMTCFIVKASNNKCIGPIKDSARLDTRDYFVIIRRSKSSTVVIKYILYNNTVTYKTYNLKFLNELYKVQSNFHSQIIKFVKSQIIRNF